MRRSVAVLHGDRTHRIPLDRAIAALRETGADMRAKYNETSLGGRAVIRDWYTPHQTEPVP